MIIATKFDLGELVFSKGAIKSGLFAPLVVTRIHLFKDDNTVRYTTTGGITKDEDALLSLIEAESIFREIIKKLQDTVENVRQKFNEVLSYGASLPLDTYIDLKEVANADRN